MLAPDYSLTVEQTYFKAPACEMGMPRLYAVKIEQRESVKHDREPSFI